MSALRVLFAALACALLPMAIGAAQDAAPSPVPPSNHAGTDVPADLLPRLRERFPEIRFDHIDPAGFAGLYEVYTDDAVVYTDAAASWVLMGQLVDARSRQNLTALRWDDHQRVDYAALPVAQAIRIVRGSGRRQISVFADPMCPYCQELEQTLEGVDDITIHLYLYPLEDIHPGASLAAQRLWCSQDAAKAWLDWMLRGTEPAALDCADNPVLANVKLGQSLRVQATPTIFLANGVRISGAVDRATLDEALAAVPGPPVDAGSVAP